MSSLILGLWALLCVNLLFHFGYVWLPGAALAVAASAPLVFIIVETLRAPVPDLGTRTSDRATVVTRLFGLLGAVSAYLTLLRLMVNFLNHAEQTLLARVLGFPVQWSVPWWIALLSWKDVVSALLVLVGGALLSASAISRVAQRMSADPPRHFKDELEQSGTRLAQVTSAADRSAMHIYHAVLRVTRAVVLVALFIGLVFADLAVRVSQAVVGFVLAVVKTVRLFLIPVVVFTSVSLLFEIIAAALGGPAGAASNQPGGVPPAASALWGGLLLATVLTLLLCGASFALNAAISNEPSSLGVVLPLALLCSLCYLLTTFVSLLFWPLAAALRQVGVSAAAVTFSPLLRGNLFVALACTAVVVVPVLVMELSPQRRLAQAPTKSNANFILGSLAVALIIMAGLAVHTGFSLVTHWVSTLA
jgi:hypothetical protein